VNLSRSFIRVRNNNERVNLKVCELAINIDGVESCNEVDQNVVYTLGDLFQQSCSKFFIGWVLGKINWNEDLLSFGINVTDINSSLVCK